MSAVPRSQVADSRQSDSPEATEALGAALAGSLAVGDLVGLEGPLGSGKTRLVQGMARGLGVRGRVRSPSFTLVNEYSGRIRLIHLDLFRLSPEDVGGLGLEELLERGAVVVEWAERLPESWLEPALVIDLVPEGGTRRRLDARAQAGRGLELLDAWRLPRSAAPREAT